MEANVVIVSVLSGGTVGGIVGATASHILTKRREAATRKLSRRKQLTDFLADWKEKITTGDASNLPSVYNRGLPDLQIKAAAVRQDLDDIQRAKFNELIGNLSRLTNDQITRPQGKMPHKLICEPLDELIGFMRGV